MAKRTKEQELKPTKKPKKVSPDVSVSLCIPSTIISATNAFNLEQITNIAYQVARAATIYDVAEIVILNIPSVDDRNSILEKKNQQVVKIDKKIKFNEIDTPQAQNSQTQMALADTDANNFELFESLLQFFITPPYLVKAMFKENKYASKFKYAAKLPKLSTLPFMCNNEVIKDFKEGLSIPKKSPGNKKNKHKLKMTKYVNIGEAEPLELSHEVPVNVRVTVDLKNKKIVSPVQAYGVIGSKSEFGYYTRSASQFNEVFTKSPHPDGYTSSVFVDCDNYFGEANEAATNTISIDSKQNNKVLLVFGNPKDLQFCLQQDSQINVPNVLDLFDQKLAVAPNVRIEDAVLIALTKLR